ncbi:MAG: 2TM domain-containing protein [Acidimicrobiia bacterium]|nr:2TM domain-containing protein [Acidimicrobiia bacterium]
MTASEDPAMTRAKKRVAEVSAFYYHLMTFVFVGFFLIIIDRMTGPNDRFAGLDWAFWVIIFWGLGVVGHAISVYFGESRVRKLYEQEKARERQGS